MIKGDFQKLTKKSDTDRLTFIKVRMMLQNSLIFVCFGTKLVLVKSR